MSAVEQLNPPLVTAVLEGSAAAQAGVVVGDRILLVNGVFPRDILEWHSATAEDLVELVIERGRESTEIVVERSPGQPFGVSVDSAVFDRIRTCDNHCDFCFIFQLPKGLRSSLYLKDDDYRLSFLYGNFTTLTRFTEADLERVITERLSPLNVSIHTTSPELRAKMLRNDRGAVSLRWLREMLKNDVKIRGQIVLCPGVNDAAQLDASLATVLNEYEDLDSVAVVPLGLSKFNPESHLRVHTPQEAADVIDQIDSWREVFIKSVGRPIVHAADEFYVVASRAIPPAEYYGSFDLYEDGIGMIRQMQVEYAENRILASSDNGFFRANDSDHRYGDVPNPNPAEDTGLRRRITVSGIEPARSDGRRVILTGEYGAFAIRNVVPDLPTDLEVLIVRNEFFGGNTAVTGLMVGEDINHTLRGVEDSVEVFLPDVCLSNGKFLDGLRVDDLIRPVTVVSSDGHTLRRIVGS